jgi:archaellum biogenesis ATPase FlaH
MGSGGFFTTTTGSHMHIVTPFYIQINHLPIFCNFNDFKEPFGINGTKGISSENQAKQTGPLEAIEASDFPFIGISLVNPIEVNGKYLVCLDFDWKKSDTKQPNAEQVQIMEELEAQNIYYETSHSGHGCHYWYLCNQEDIPKSINYGNGHEIEIFSGFNGQKSNVLITDKGIKGSFKYVHTPLLQSNQRLPLAPTTNDADDDFYIPSKTKEQVVEVLNRIPNTAEGLHYNDFIKIGMVIKTELGDDGFDVWDDWAKQSTKYRPMEMEKHWNSFKGHQLKFGTLVHYSKQFEPTEVTPTGSKLNILTQLYKLRTTDAMVKDIEEATFIYGSLLVKSHLTVVAAAPNSGKTTIFTYISGVLAAEGYEVIYVNVDASGPEIKTHHEHAQKYGYAVIAPDLHVGTSVLDATKALENLAVSGEDLSNVVLILDTLKKFVDVINKSNAKKFYGTLRSLTTKGATVIMLSHTNKYNDPDGKPIYEGTGDLRADVDELIYLVSGKKEQGGDLFVSATIDKAKSKATNMGFIIDGDSREVSLMGEFIDASEIAKDQKQLLKDRPTITGLVEIIEANGPMSLSELTRYGSKNGLGSREVVRKVLTRYSTGENQIFTMHAGQTKGVSFSLKEANAQ